MVLGWLVLIGALVLSLIRKQRIGPVWLTAVAYAVACQVPIYLMRSSKLTALVLAQTLRYLPDLVVVLALLAAVALSAPNRTGAHWLDASVKRTVLATGLAVLFLASSLYSTATFLTSWRTIRRALFEECPRRFGGRTHRIECAAAGSGGRSAGATTGGRAGESGQSHLRPAAGQTGIFFGDNAIAHAGQRWRLVDARVTWVRTIAPGPTPQCGYFTQRTGRRTWSWMARCCRRLDRRIELSGNSDGSMTLSMTQGPAVKVPVHPGLNRVFADCPCRGRDHGAGRHRGAVVVHRVGPVGFLAPS